MLPGPGIYLILLLLPLLLAPLNRLLLLLAGVAPRLQPLGLVVNRYRPRSVEHQYRLAELRDLFGDAVLAPVIEERVGLQQAQGGAVPLHRYEGASGKRLTEDFDALLGTVMDSRQNS